MERSASLQRLADDAKSLIDAAGAAGPETPVPGRDDRTVSDVVWELATEHDFWSYVVREGATAAGSYVRPERPRGADAAEQIAGFATDRAGELHRALAAADPARPVWTGTDDTTVAWVIRRMANETALARVDVEGAAGRGHRLDPEVAADGIDEFLTHFLARSLADSGPLEATVHVHCTDADGEWTVRPSADGGYTVTREHAKGDVALRGDAHDLLMVLRGRASLDTVTVFGDPVLAARFAGAPPGDVAPD